MQEYIEINLVNLQVTYEYLCSRQIGIVGHPMNFVCFHFSEFFPFCVQYRFQICFFSEHKVSTVLASQDFVRFEHVLNVFCYESCFFTYVLNRNTCALVVAPQQNVQHSVCPVAHVRPVSQVTQWSLWCSLLLLNFRQLVRKVN